MIVFRYLAREVLLTLSAVSGVLLVIIMSGRFIRYLAQAAQGMLEPGILLAIIGLRIPGFLQLILPLGLFLGILLAYGRLYLDSEMTVLSATGMSNRRLLAYSLWPALLVALATGVLSLYLAPLGTAKVSQLLNDQQSMTEFDTLVAGRFQSIKGGNRVTYTEEMSEERDQLSGVFISEKKTNSEGKDNGITVLVAQTGHQVIQPDGARYLVLKDGYRFDGTPGQADYRAIQYNTYGVLLPRPEAAEEISRREAIPSSDLWGSEDLTQRVELQWRLSIPLLVFVVTLLAVPLAKVNPRQGRFLKLLPAILLYMAYLGLLIAMRGKLDKGQAAYTLWLVHGVFALLGLLLINWENLRLALAARGKREMAHD